MNRGFTLVELVVSIAIFTLMTALVVVKYGTFNQSTLLTDTAYDIGLALHTAQTYGLSVKNFNTSFSLAYGIDFAKGGTNNACGQTGTTDGANIILFADISPSTPDGICGGSDANVTTYAITRGAIISELCAGTESACDGVSHLDVSFQRPNPEANICGDGSCGLSYALVTLLGTDGSTRQVSVRQNGQISVVQ